MKQVWPGTARAITARADSSPCLDRGMNVVVIACDLYNGTLTGDKAATVGASSGMSANHAGPAVIVGAFMAGQGAKARSIAWHDDGTTPTLKSALSGGNTAPTVVYPINTMVATRGGRDDMRTCFGVGEPNDPQFTISAAHSHGVCYERKNDSE